MSLREIIIKQLEEADNLMIEPDPLAIVKEKYPLLYYAVEEYRKNVNVKYPWSFREWVYE